MTTQLAPWETSRIERLETKHQQSHKDLLDLKGAVHELKLRLDLWKWIALNALVALAFFGTVIALRLTS